MKIYKYKLSVLAGSQAINIPSPQRFLSFQLQDGYPCVWYEVTDPENNVRFDRIEFIVIGTGFDVPENAHYLGTAQQGPFVWHLYTRCNL